MKTKTVIKIRYEVMKSGEEKNEIFGRGRIIYSEDIFELKSDLLPEDDYSGRVAAEFLCHLKFNIEEKIKESEEIAKKFKKINHIY